MTIRYRHRVPTIALPLPLPRRQSRQFKSPRIPRPGEFQKPVAHGSNFQGRVRPAESGGLPMRFAVSDLQGVGLHHLRRLGRSRRHADAQFDHRRVFVE